MLHWIAHYFDGGQLAQYKPDGELANYADIDRENLIAFDLWNGNNLLIRVDLRAIDCDNDIEPKRLIYRIRTQKTVDGRRNRVHLVGWQRKVNGRNVQAINYIFEDGSILLGGQFIQRDAIPMHDIQPFPFETDLIGA